MFLTAVVEIILPDYEPSAVRGSEILFDLW